MCCQSHGPLSAITITLRSRLSADGLLLVFILLELLAGVRETMRQKKLIAEPFLIVGIITSIKEIVVLTLQTTGGKGLDHGAFARP